jgi:hypothetical protein
MATLMGNVDRGDLQRSSNMRSRVIPRTFVLAVLCIALPHWAGAATLYTDKSDRELTDLAADWTTLSEDQRRALLTEIKARMHASGKQPVLTIKTERRYGRIVRQPDGSLVRIETTEHVVRYQALPERVGDQPFGVGFEQRVVSGGAPAATTPDAPLHSVEAPHPPPVVNVGTNANHR